MLTHVKLAALAAATARGIAAATLVLAGAVQPLPSLVI